MIFKKGTMTFDFNGPKIIYSNNPFQLIKNLIINNSKIMVITPITKINELYEIKNNSFLLNYLYDLLDKPLFDERNILEIEDKIYKNLGKILSISTNNLKIMKSFIDISDDFIDELILKKFLKKLHDYNFLKNVLIVGFENIKEIIEIVEHSENIFFIMNNLSNAKLSKKYLEMLILEKQEDYLEINDFSVLKFFLENLLEKELSDNQICNYFLNKGDNFTNFLIESALKNNI